jgi:5-methylcytosine-specific restriction enzyme A
VSQHRIKPDAGWVHGKRPLGPNGKPLCRWCQHEIEKKGRSTFCSDPCVHEWRIRSDPGYARRQVEKRGAGICQICGVDTNRIKRALLKAKTLLQGDDWWSAPRAPWAVRNTAAVRHARRLVRLLSSHRWPIVLTVHATGCYTFHWPHLFEVDHILPVVEGGGGCGLENLRLLCRPCHRQETKALGSRLRNRRRALDGSSQTTLLEVLRAEVVGSRDGASPQAPGSPALGGAVEPGGPPPKEG